MKAGHADASLERQRFTVYAAFSGVVHEISEVGSTLLALQLVSAYLKETGVLRMEKQHKCLKLP